MDWIELDPNEGHLQCSYNLRNGVTCNKPATHVPPSYFTPNAWLGEASCSSHATLTATEQNRRYAEADNA